MRDYRMPRRSLLKGLGALGLLTGIPLSCSKPPSEGPALWDTALELSRNLRSKQQDPSALLKAHLAAIEELNPQLRAVIETNPDAQAEAARSRNIDHEFSGIPILLKDNMATGDRQVTSAGSAALADSRYPTDASVAKRLRQAGLVIIGKANLTEWANFRSRHCTSGWSARGGQCRNPHVLDRCPSGSSSGSAVAVASGMVPWALGTETMGSVVCPASACGIVGFKPSLGLISTEGVIPVAASFDCVGTLTRTVQDAAALFGVLTEPIEILARGALQGTRIGVARRDWGFNPQVDQVLEEQLSVLSRLGAELVDPVEVPTYTELFKDFLTILSFEFKDGLNRYLSGQAPEAKTRTLSHVIAFNEQHPELEAMDALGQALLLDAEKRADLQDPTYLAALNRIQKTAGRAKLEGVFASQRLDAIVAPTFGPASVIEFGKGDRAQGGGMVPPAVAGCPHLTVPAGQLDGLPIGLSLYSPHGSDQRLLALAYDYEQETQHRQRPRYLTTIGGRPS